MGMEQGTRTRVTTVLILLLVLIAGSVLGIAVDRRLAGRSASDQETISGTGEAEGEGQAGSGAEDSRSRRRLIVEHVGLSEEQKAQVDSIVAHYRERMGELQRELEDELRQAYQPRYRELLTRTREEIRGVLTPPQQVQYDSLLADYDRRREEHRNRESEPDSAG